MTHEQGDRAFPDALEAALDGRAVPADTLSGEDRAIAALASDLAKADFSAAYGDRAALRRRLIGQHEGSQVGWSPSGDRAAMSKTRRRLVTAAVALVVVGGLAFARFSPALASSRQKIVTWMAEDGNLPEDLQQVIIPIFGGPVGVGNGAIMGSNGAAHQIGLKTVKSVEEAQAAAAFTLKQLTALPDGFTLKSGFVTEDGSKVYLNYENGSDGAIAFSQSTAAPPAGAEDLPSEMCIAVGEPPAPARADGGAPESGGQSATEGPGGPAKVVRSGEDQLQCSDIEVNSIRWEADGIFYQLIGTLSQADLQAVADSAK